MKKLAKSILMLSIASLAILSSCSKEDENAEVTDVKVDVTSSPSGAVEVNSTVSLTISATGNTGNNLKSISVSRNDGKVLLSSSLSGVSQTRVIVDTVGSAASYTYTVAVTGEKGSPATKTITVQTRESYGSIVVTPVAIDLYGQTQDSSQNYFMKLSDPFTPYDRARSTFASNKANIDLCFYYGNTNKATVASPSDNLLQSVYTYITWTGAKVTRFAKTSLTSSAFDAIQDSESDSAIIELARTVTNWGSFANELKVNDVVIYETAQGVKGLIRVENLSGTQANDATISLRVMAQD